MGDAMAHFIKTGDIRIGMVGVAPAAEMIAGIYSSLPGVKVTAVCDADPQKAGRLSEKLGLSKFFTDSQEMMKAAGVDAVEILTAPERHLEEAQKASALGKHIALHKPLTVSPADARAITVAIGKSGVVAMVLDPLMFHPFVRQAKVKLEAEAVGEIQSLRVKSHAGRLGGLGLVISPKRLADPNFNLLLERPFEKVAVIEMLMGPIEEVFCYAGTYSRMVSFKFQAAGRYGVHEAVYSPDLLIHTEVMPIDNSLEITGTDGILWLRNLTALMVEAPKLMLKRKEQITIWDDKVEYGFINIMTDLRKHFIECIRGRARPRYSIQQAHRSLLINAATHTSLIESRPIRLADFTG